ncbi:MAG: serine/threonine-protein phosphatase [Planctomycetaceae bacterium]|nr:serine/threonine-protein phosphatase [Planctomycetaceae bacterium]
MSDIGFRRRNNQDSYSIQTCSDRETWQRSGHVFLVADGMGGHAVGELASKIAADTIPHTFRKTRNTSTEDALRMAIEEANASIYRRGQLNPDFLRMGTTCTTLVLGPRGVLIGHVGDSRCYRARNNRLDQLSFDHSLQWELLKQGRMKPEDIFLHEPRHVITRSLGPEEKVQVDVEGPLPVLPGDTYLLCSDGLTGHLNDEEIGTIIGNLAPSEACRLLVNLANLRGGSDNITVVIVRAGRLPKGAEPALPPVEEEPPGDRLRAWAWLAANWFVAMLLVAGICGIVLGKLWPGLSLLSLGIVLTGAMIIYWLRHRPAPDEPDDADRTVHFRPYRSAPARLNQNLLEHLASVDSELHRTATEEGWDIDHTAHDAAWQKARAALQEQDHKTALEELAHGIDLLMTGVHQHRKQVSHNSRWGRRPSPDAEQSRN